MIERRDGLSVLHARGLKVSAGHTRGQSHPQPSHHNRHNRPDRRPQRSLQKKQLARIAYLQIY